MRKLLLLALTVLASGALVACAADTENVEPIGPTTTAAGAATSASPPDVSVPSKTYTGTGNQQLTIEPPVPGVPFVATITSTEAGPFIVDGLDASGQAVDNLVDVLAAYTGTVPIDFNPSLSKVSTLDIQAPGPWTVEVKALSDIPRFTTDYSGTGDDVVVYTGERGNATFVRKGTGSVVVSVYPSLNGGLPDTLVNGKDDVQTAVLIPSSGVVQVQTEGPWSFEPV